MVLHANPPSALGWQTLSLWPHQRDSVEHILKYVESYTANPRAALIKMPTGTGKSGVMAVLSRLIAGLGDVLVLVPWDSVAEQLRRDILFRFWEVVGVDGHALPKHVARMVPSSVGRVLEKHPRGSLVLVGTIQALQMTAKEQASKFAELRSRVDLVFFDEGHREPATTWSSTIRELQRPTVLFTATPYRNDHKLFNVDDQYVFNYSHHVAVDQKYIRALRVLKEDFRTEEEFVDKLLDVYAQRFPKSRYHDSPPHVIVRCATSVQIDRIHRMLLDRKQHSVAIHDTFPNDPQRGRFHSVSIARDADADAVFWVHQYKLLEGFDDKRCRMLALFEPLETTRALVQQVGRVLRSTNLQARQEAFLLCSERSEVAEEWERYLQWDRTTGSSGDVLQDDQMFRRIYEALPELTYYQGGFRERADLNTVDVEHNLWFRRSASIFQRLDGADRINLDAVVANLQRDYIDEDIQFIREAKPDEKTRVLLYMAYASSQLFPKDFLIEYRAGYSLIRAEGKYVYFYDSTGVPAPKEIWKSCRPVAPERLRNLFPHEACRLASVTLLNTDLGRTSIRRRVTAAYDLGETGVTLSDHLQVCANAVGYIDIQPAKPRPDDGKRHVKTRLRRYVGLTTGRISEDDLPEGGDFAGYVRWLKAITASLRKDGTKPVRFFARFAEPAVVPADPTPVNVLLDLEDFRQAYFFRSTDESAIELMTFDDLCIDISPATQTEGDEHKYEGTFVLTVNGRPIEMKIKYHDHGYEIASPGLDHHAVISSAVRGRQKMNAVAYLNREQCFRVVTRTPGVIYAHNRFYQPRLKYFGAHGEEKIDLLDLLIDVPELATIASEKGRTYNNGKGWNLDTLFGTIDARGRGTRMWDHFQGFNTLVCDDRGRNEIADFIGARTLNDAPRVVMIHAKHFLKPRPLSASALAEVMSQATKNLHYLNPHTNATPPNLDLWDSPWVEEGDLTVDRRIRPPDRRKAARVWREVLATIRKPGATREVWIVLGKGLSRSRVAQGVTTATPEPQAVQIVYQLLSTWAQVASMGAALRIFCSP